ncbi:pectin lyase-like protein [Eremomyces bilateralis CBS 781.70]|uniref:pectate lyase n=1 Tax=Eremomyces bilateralis CBS 781.70 TaxID=1392243 RepID=A0A6G1GD06_9PEZI|nr:pectin lyase-like protein [Eremomyces bilateralis CBS 781.70]KAF1815892.1 pectin lyase-like protein [Eremomyces bilateralis CBS 781.70]
MKFAEFAVAAVAVVSGVDAFPTLLKRASVSEAASVGFATLNGGTKGGAGGPTVNVASADALQSAVEGNDPKIVVITGPISGAVKIKIGSNKTILGKDSSAKLNGVGLSIDKQKNVIIRNIVISKVVAKTGDAISIQRTTNVWIDHCDLSSDREHDKDYYDGLLDVTHAGDFVTISNTYLHDHWKASLVGHSDSNKAEDTGHLRVTYVNNRFAKINSRAPSFRFGTGHILNNLFEDVADGINTRLGAQLLVEGNAFVGAKKPLYSTDQGFAVEKNNDFGGGANTAPKGTLTSVPYEYKATAAGQVKAAVSGAGATLKF